MIQRRVLGFFILGAACGGGCGDTLVVMHQIVEIRIRDRATLQPASLAEGTWQIAAADPKQFAKCDESGLSQFTATHGAIVGATPMPFSATMVKFRMESRDYVSGLPAEIVVIDSQGRDTCSGPIKAGGRLTGARHCVDFVSIRRAKMELQRESGEN